MSVVPQYTVFGTSTLASTIDPSQPINRVMTMDENGFWTVNDSIHASIINANYTAGIETKSSITIISSFDAHKHASIITPSSITYDGIRYTSSNNIKFDLSAHHYRLYRHVLNSGNFDIRSIATGVIHSPNIIQRHLVVTAATCRNGTILISNGDGRFNIIIPLISEVVNRSPDDIIRHRHDTTFASWNGIAIGPTYKNGRRTAQDHKDNIIIVVGTACDVTYRRPCAIVLSDNAWKTMYVDSHDDITPQTLTALDNRLPWNDVKHIPELHCYCAVADLSDVRYHHNDIGSMYSFATSENGLEWRHCGKLPIGNQYHLLTFIRGFIVIFTDNNLDHNGVHGFVIGKRDETKIWRFTDVIPLKMIVKSVIRQSTSLMCFGMAYGMHTECVCKISFTTIGGYDVKYIDGFDFRYSWNVAVSNVSMKRGSTIMHGKVMPSMSIGDDVDTVDDVDIGEMETISGDNMDDVIDINETDEIDEIDAKYVNEGMSMRSESSTSTSSVTSSTHSQSSTTTSLTLTPSQSSTTTSLTLTPSQSSISSRSSSTNHDRFLLVNRPDSFSYSIYTYSSQSCTHFVDIIDPIYPNSAVYGHLAASPTTIVIVTRKNNSNARITRVARVDRVTRKVTFNDIPIANCNGVLYGNNTFVVFGDSTIVSSFDDAITWDVTSSDTTATYRFNSGVFANGRFVIVGGGFNMMWNSVSSVNGKTWEFNISRGDNSKFKPILAVVDYLKSINRYVSLAQYTAKHRGAGITVTSTNGSYWNVHKIDNVPPCIRCHAATTKFVVVGSIVSDKLMITMSRGHEWFNINTPVTDTIAAFMMSIDDKVVLTVIDSQRTARRYIIRDDETVTSDDPTLTAMSKITSNIIASTSTI